MSTPIDIARGSPLGADVRPLIEAAHAYSAALYPADSNHYLSLEALAGPDVVFLVARHGGRAVGTGAMMRHDAALGEVKQMWADPALRGLGLGRRILERIEMEARADGLPALALETGIHNHAALRLYRAAGYRDCPPFADYMPDPLSVFLRKELS